jgi:hypothetical protein
MQFLVERIPAGRSQRFRLELKTEPGRTVPFYFGLGISDMTQQSALDVAAFADVNPLYAAKNAVDARRAGSVRPNGNVREGERVILRKGQMKPFLWSHIATEHCDASRRGASGSVTLVKHCETQNVVVPL